MLFEVAVEEVALLLLLRRIDCKFVGNSIACRESHTSLSDTCYILDPLEVLKTTKINVIRSSSFFEGSDNVDLGGRQATVGEQTRELCLTNTIRNYLLTILHNLKLYHCSR